MGRHFVEAVREERLFELAQTVRGNRTPPQLNEGEDMFTISSEGGSQHYQFSILPMRLILGRHPGGRFTSSGYHPITRAGPLEERICPDCLPRVAHPADQREYGRGFADGVGGGQIDRQGTGIAVRPVMKTSSAFGPWSTTFWTCPRLRPANWRCLSSGSCRAFSLTRPWR